MNYKQNLKELLEKLEGERAKILFTLCEDERVFFPEIILSLVYRLRSIIKVIKTIKEGGF